MARRTMAEKLEMQRRMTRKKMRRRSHSSGGLKVSLR